MKCIDIVFSTKTVGSYGDVFTVIQTLGSGNLLNCEQVNSIVKNLAEFLNILKGEAEIHKLIQVLLTLINKNTVLTVCHKINEMGLKIFAINNLLLQNTVPSLLKYLYSVLFSLLTPENIQEVNTEPFTECYTQLKVLRRMIEGSKDIKQKIIAIDLLWVILTEFGDIVSQSTKIRNDIIQPLFPILFKYMQGPNIPYGFLFHVVNLSVRIILSCTKYYELLLPIIKWENMEYFVLEVIGVVLSSYRQVQILSIIINTEANCNMLKLLLDTIEGIIERINFIDTFPSVNGKFVLMNKEMILVDIGKWGTMKLPKINQGQFLWLSINVLFGLVKSLEDLNDKQIVINIAKEVWKTIHKLLINLFTKALSQENIQKVLITFQRFIKVLATVKLIVPMNTIIQSLAKFALPLEISIV